MRRPVPNPPGKIHGGKQPLASWLHSIAPPSFHDEPETGYTHRNIVCAGMLGETLNWLPILGISETVNDVNSEATNFWHVIQNQWLFAEFCRLAETTPFSQDKFGLSHLLTSNVAIQDAATFNHSERAWHFFNVMRMSRQGLGEDYAIPTRRTRGAMHEHVSAYLGAVEGLIDVHARIRRIEIRNLDFRKFIQLYDHVKALFYVDPPYLPSTRNSVGQYAHEMSFSDHAACLDQTDGPYVPHAELGTDRPKGMLDILMSIKGKFMLSGYPSVCYDSWAEMYGYRRITKEVDNKASGKKQKPKELECVYVNY